MLPRLNATSQSSRRGRKHSPTSRNGMKLLKSRSTFSRHDSVSAKAYRTVTPAASLLLQKRWDEMKYDEHRRKVVIKIIVCCHLNHRNNLHIFIMVYSKSLGKQDNVRDRAGF